MTTYELQNYCRDLELENQELRGLIKKVSELASTTYLIKNIKNQRYLTKKKMEK